MPERFLSSKQRYKPVTLPQEFSDEEMARDWTLASEDADMVLPAFNANSLRARLAKLDSGKQLAFGAVTCERLLPNYASFQKHPGWGDVALLRKALDFVWSSIGSESIDAQVVRSITASIEAATPDSEDYETVYADLARDACLCVLNLLGFLSEKDVDKIIYAVTYATDSVDLYVQEIESLDPNDPELEQKILNHRLMQRELVQQEKNLVDIGRASALSPDFLNALKASWNNEGKSNLDLP